LSCLFQALINAQLESPYEGTWTNEFGGNLAICVEQKNLFGLYSQLGYIRGTVTGVIFEGLWFGCGLKTLDQNGDCCVDNYGTVATTIILDTKIAGSLVPVNPNGVQNLFQGDIISNATTNGQLCLEDSIASESFAVANTLQGKWTALERTLLWDICFDEFGNTNGSYEYMNAGSLDTIRGYTTGRCFFNNSFCQMDWFEEDQSWGGYLTTIYDNTTMYTSWWTGPSWQIDFSNVGDPNQHASEILLRISTNPDRCQRNVKYFFNAYNTTSNDYRKTLAISIFVFALMM